MVVMMVLIYSLLKWRCSSISLLLNDIWSSCSINRETVYMNKSSFPLKPVSNMTDQRRRLYSSKSNTNEWRHQYGFVLNDCIACIWSIKAKINIPLFKYIIHTLPVTEYLIFWAAQNALHHKGSHPRLLQKSLETKLSLKLMV